MKEKLKVLAFLSATVLSVQTAHSADISWSGFLSTVGGQTLEDNTTYDVGFVGYSAEYDDDLDFSAETAMGLQGLVKVSDKLRATVQLVARGLEDFDVEAEWAYLSYAASENLTFNSGRFRVPLYYYSDFLDVGYAYHWIRPPAEMYGGPSRMDGANLYYQKYLGEFELSTQIFAGSASIDDELSEQQFDYKSIYGFNIQLAREWWKIRYVYAPLDLNVIYTGPNPFIPDLVVLDGYFEGGAVIVDIDNFMFRGEYAVLSNNKDLMRDNWYANVAYRFGDWTPHLTFSSREAAFGAQAAEITTAGVAWNFDPSAVFKFELSSVDIIPEAAIDFDVVSFGIDIVF